MVEAILSDFPDLGVRVLSVDTAVNDVFNVHDPKLWHFLLDVAAAGRVLGLLLGPPCETWTSARHHQQLDEHGHAVRGPRPLRAASELWGMAHLTISELAQVYTGNCLLLKGLLLACVTTFNGGATFLEHPAVPYDETFPSIWRTGLIKLLLRFSHGPFRKTTIEQWKYGAPSVKPTTLLYSNADLTGALELCRLRGLVRPAVQLIGKNKEGQYHTAAAKEYPAALNRSFAEALRSLFSSLVARAHAPGDIEHYGLELAQLAASTEYGGAMQPDYQPDRH